MELDGRAGHRFLWPACPVQARTTKGDCGIEKMRKQLETADSEEDHQTVGLLCREALISLGQAVYEPAVHQDALDTTPSSTDAKRMLEAYIATELAGKSNDEARKYSKASVDFANALQHRRTATFRDAALCAEATSSVVNIIAIISGKRDPKEDRLQEQTPISLE